jgi:putative DNA methylase
MPSGAAPIVAPKKLIEVALPLDAINKASAREKSIRHGHPSTLHLWWARRPLAAARAVLFAQLVNDPSWKYTPEELKKPQVQSAITRKRNELFRLIEQLVPWENTNNREVLDRAHKEIVASWKETCEANKNHPEAKTLFDPKKLPAFHDPFAGGGTIPLEAQRLGLEAHASDLNPVAVLINKAMIEIPPKFAGRAPVGPLPKSEKQTKSKATEDWSGARGLAEDVRRYGAWMREEAEKRIGHLYPKVKITAAMAKERPDLEGLVGRELTVIAWLWARTVKSPNPAYSDVDVPLASTFVLASKEGKEAYVEPVVSGKTYRFTVKVGEPSSGAADGTKAKGRGANFACIFSGSPVTGDHIKAEGQAGRMGQRLMAVVVEGDRTRIYLTPTVEMEATAGAAKPVWAPDIEFLQQALGFRVGNYGLTRWSHLFTNRQLVALTTLSDLVVDAIQRCADDASAAGMPEDTRGLESGGSGASAYAQGVGIYLALGASKLADYNCSLASWSPTRDQAAHVFKRQALPMVWDFPELNPFADAAGDLSVSISGIAGALTMLGGVVPGVASQRDAQTQSISAQKVVSTDPPYYDNIGYADLSDFFYVWLRNSLRPVLPELVATLAVPKEEELVATPQRHGGKKEAENFFLDGMTRAIHNLAVRASQAFPITIYYAFKQSDTEDEAGTSSTGWETFLQAVVDAGFGISGTWPMRTERESRSRGMASNALASSIVLVCRARSGNAPVSSRKDFLRELERTLPRELSDMTSDAVSPLAPVDLAQAAIGPGMAIFSKYSAVLEADGSPMPVKSALVHINKAVDSAFSDAEGALDADTRFCIGWFSQYGFEDGPFGEADVLARAKGTAVDGVVEAGVLASSKGKVRLLKVKEYPKAWDPTKDTRLPVWEACHQMCRALGESEHAAGKLLARMADKEDAVRQLSYRLYTLCERKGWAEQARAYNELVTSWPGILEESHKTGVVGEQLGLLGERKE